MGAMSRAPTGPSKETTLVVIDQTEAGLPLKNRWRRGELSTFLAIRSARLHERLHLPSCTHLLAENPVSPEWLNACQEVALHATRHIDVLFLTHFWCLCAQRTWTMRSSRARLGHFD